MATLIVVASSAKAQDAIPPVPAVQDQPLNALPAQQPEAGNAHLQKGEALFAEKKYQAAIDEFYQAYKILEGHPERAVILFNIGKCHEKLNRFESAAEFYRRYLSEAGPAAEDRASLEQTLLVLDAKASEIDRLFAEAKNHVEQGESLYQARDFSAALAEFEKAYELLRGHPNRSFVLFNMGKCYERIFRYDLAIRSYRRYLDQAGEKAEDRVEVEAKLRVLQSLLGRLLLSTNTRAEVWINNHMIGFAPGEILVPGGRHMLELRAKNHLPVKTEIQLTARELKKLSFVLDPIVEFKGIRSVYFWTGAALSAVALGVGIALGVQVIEKDDQGQAQPKELSQRELEEEIKDLALTADIFYGTSFLLSVGSVVLFLLTDWSDSAGKKERATTSRTRIEPRLNTDSFSLNVEGYL